MIRNMYWGREAAPEEEEGYEELNTNKSLRNYNVFHHAYQNSVYRAAKKTKKANI